MAHQGDVEEPGLSARRAMHSRRAALRIAAGTGVAALAAPTVARAATAGQPPGGPIVKPLPPELFIVHGSNAETRWSALRHVGNIVPADRFFVRNHTRTPRIDPGAWRLRLFGTGLAGGPFELSLAQLKALPSETITARIECAGNGRGFFETQQNQPVPGTPWRLGAVGVARWRGVRLATVLRAAGLTRGAVDVMPSGLDDEYIVDGVNLGRVRRPLPVRKALNDVLLAYEMNGEPLPPDHGFPVRVVVPDWIGIASVKWVGAIEVSATPLRSPWNTRYYRLFGPDYPEEGTLLTRQNTKSAFELDPHTEFGVGRDHVLHGRSWSGTGGVARVDVSADGGRTWSRAIPRAIRDDGWHRWSYRWRPRRPGSYTLSARALDIEGNAQPLTEPFNTEGYLFGAVAALPVAAS
ncbi:sulfite oxidase [Prauserella marina]|uniref:DMSO/TMAO reductase YedYZ, molybdopterin-dependent catalytic subunit n=1 Tax=Prauserella marina TaxID=530584 RepID=A0A222VS35_9PSEU|nr:sulfite oxidase [Prauserella marina]ASR36727.1 sulfite oxidase [Prauserella marina]PWV80394.1 DMSO/TMAO reductase YedYZ molybdopterin-dependent catalytic subunit [Prauserella marina]SDD53379.1 DMSO/TMAO reductase YedYZ, molybdopterin-dependent catalytic subunit [Prauserella marina]